MISFKDINTEKLLHWYNYSTLMENMHLNLLRENDNYLNSKKCFRPRIKNLREANKFSTNFYREVKEELLRELSKNDLSNLLNIFCKSSMPPPFNFKYLIRDWSKDNQNSRERQKILEVLSTYLNVYNLQAEKALFLGCGTGRYVVDLHPFYRKADAFDNNFFMIWSLRKLWVEKEWKIINKNSKNSALIKNVAPTFHLKITDAQCETISKKINFSVDDFRDFGTKDDLYDHLFSIYFTDVLPFELFFEKITSLLKINGYFIHFGPLDYFFTNENEMLSAEEIYLHFESQGFKIIHHDFVTTSHLYITSSMRNHSYNNWFFIAQKLKTDTLNWSTRLKLSPLTRLTSKKILDGKQIKEVFEIENESSNFNLKKPLYDLLIKFHLKTFTLSQLINEFPDNLTNSEKKNLLQIFITLKEYKLVIYAG